MSLMKWFCLFLIVAALVTACIVNEILSLMILVIILAGIVLFDTFKPDTSSWTPYELPRTSLDDQIYTDVYFSEQYKHYGDDFEEAYVPQLLHNQYKSYYAVKRVLSTPSAGKEVKEYVLVDKEKYSEFFIKQRNFFRLSPEMFRKRLIRKYDYYQQRSLN